MSLKIPELRPWVSEVLRDVVLATWSVISVSALPREKEVGMEGLLKKWFRRLEVRDTLEFLDPLELLDPLECWE